MKPTAFPERVVGTGYASPTSDLPGLKSRQGRPCVTPFPLLDEWAYRLAIDLTGSRVAARFWCEVLDFVVLDREDDGTLENGPREGFGGPQPTIIFGSRDEPEKGKSRLTSARQGRSRGMS